MELQAFGRAHDTAPIIAKAADATGVDFALLMHTAGRESSFNPNAKARTSSATGLYQFIDSTWLAMVKRHGDKHGLGNYADAITETNGRYDIANPAMKKKVLSLRLDPEISARMAAEFTAENAKFLEGRLGRKPTSGELYVAHVMGPSGAAQLITLAADKPKASAASVFPAAAKANKALFFDSSGRPRSAVAVLDRLAVEVKGYDALRPKPATEPATVSLATPNANLLHTAMVEEVSSDTAKLGLSPKPEHVPGFPREITVPRLFELVDAGGGTGPAPARSFRANAPDFFAVQALASLIQLNEAERTADALDYFSALNQPQTRDDA